MSPFTRPILAPRPRQSAAPSDACDPTVTPRVSQAAPAARSDCRSHRSPLATVRAETPVPFVSPSRRPQAGPGAEVPLTPPLARGTIRPAAGTLIGAAGP